MASAMQDVSNAKELQASPGEPPHAVHLLQLPVYDMTKRERGKYIKTTAVIADPGSSTPPMLVAALEEQYGYTVLTYDMETLRVRQRLLGHLYEITAIAVPPPSWQGAPLFATASKTGDVKVGCMSVDNKERQVCLCAPTCLQVTCTRCTGPCIRECSSRCP